MNCLQLVKIILFMDNLRVERLISAATEENAAKCSKKDNSIPMYKKSKFHNFIRPVLKHEFKFKKRVA
jgi:hypothetical protein